MRSIGSFLDELIYFFITTTIVLAKFKLPDPGPNDLPGTGGYLSGACDSQMCLLPKGSWIWSMIVGLVSNEKVNF